MVLASASPRASSRPAPLPRSDHRDARIRQTSTGFYEVEAKLFEELLRRPSSVAPRVEVTPVTEDGLFIGHALTGITPGSVLDRLGLADDDVIELVNGENGRTASSVEAARATAERTAQVSVVLRRNGFQKLMMYRLVYY